MPAQMKKTISKNDLRARFGLNKKIPFEYEEVILQALAHFPELASTHIEFELKKRSEMPCNTLPSLMYFVKPSMPRKYVVSISEEARPLERDMLFKNLPPEAQLGVIGHELGRIIYFNRFGRSELFKICYVFANIERKRDMERNADIVAIEHGLGSELYTYAVYARNNKAFVNRHRELDIYYLKPNEILQGMSGV
jgi:hypothetical protein